MINKTILIVCGVSLIMLGTSMTHFYQRQYKKEIVLADEKPCKNEVDPTGTIIGTASDVSTMITDGYLIVNSF